MPKEILNKTSEDRRQRLLASAVREFGEHGLDRANVNRIADQAGIARGSIYTYFTDKRELLAWVLEQIVSSVGQVVRALHLQHDGGLPDALSRLFLAMAGWVRDHRVEARVYLLSTMTTDSDLAESVAKVRDAQVGALYRRLLALAKERSEVPQDLDIGQAAFLLDAYSVTYMAGRTGMPYWKARARYLIGHELVSEQDDFAALVHTLLRSWQVEAAAYPRAAVEGEVAGRGDLLDPSGEKVSGS